MLLTPASKPTILKAECAVYGLTWRLRDRPSERMTMHRRISAIVWLTTTAFAVLPHAALAQVVPPFPTGQREAPPDTEGQHVVSTRELLKRLKRAKQLLAEQNYSESVRFLQAILENDEDAFFFPDPEDKTKERSLKLEAQMLLGGMPPEIGRAHV